MAGIYCSEPCACQGCLNRPIHEEIVLSTRKQIEARNPLAFAPKIIQTSGDGQEIGVRLCFGIWFYGLFLLLPLLDLFFY